MTATPTPPGGRSRALWWPLDVAASCAVIAGLPFVLGLPIVGLLSIGAHTSWSWPLVVAGTWLAGFLLGPGLIVSLYLCYRLLSLRPK